jgi:hypothetical protein
MSAGPEREMKKALLFVTNFALCTLPMPGSDGRFVRAGNLH